MKKFELKVNYDGKLMYHAIYNMTDEEQQELLNKTVGSGGVTGNLLTSEMEDVFSRFGIEEDVERPLDEIAKEYPDALIASAIQELCYDAFGLNDHEAPSVAKDTAVLCERIYKYEWTCDVIE